MVNDDATREMTDTVRTRRARRLLRNASTNATQKRPSASHFARASRAGVRI